MSPFDGAAVGPGPTAPNPKRYLTEVEGTARVSPQSSVATLERGPGFVLLGDDDPVGRLLDPPPAAAAAAAAATATPAAEEEADDAEEENVVEEGRAPRIQKPPKTPTEAERRDHEDNNHATYRAWCRSAS